jgi:hypothetical protein
MKKCPYCAEQIQDEAIKCRYCGSMLPGGAAPAANVVTAGPWLQDVRNLVLQGQKIEAIKLVRQQTRSGLKDAKDFVEGLERGGNPAVPQPSATAPNSTGCIVIIVAILIGLAVALFTFFSRR